MSEMEYSIKNIEYLTPNVARELGVSKYKFYKYIHDNDMEKVGHGFYIQNNEIKDELYLLSKRCPNAIFSHDEAFYYHNLNDREPFVHTMTIYSGYNSHRLTNNDKCKVYTVKKELLNVGKIIVKDNFGNEVPMYDLERTICDLIRSRNNIEIQDFNCVLKTYVTRKDKNLNRLMKYAKLFKVDNIMRKCLEILL